MSDGVRILLSLAAIVVPLAIAWLLVGRSFEPRRRPSRTTEAIVRATPPRDAP